MFLKYMLHFIQHIFAWQSPFVDMCWVVVQNGCEHMGLWQILIGATLINIININLILCNCACEISMALNYTIVLFENNTQSFCNSN